jgi:hypothetical protein
MIRIDPYRHALGHPDESPFFSGSQETSVHALCLLERSAASLGQSLGVNLFWKISK